MPGEVSKAKLDGLKAGIANVLGRIDTLIQAEAYAEKLPILGDKLATASPALETLTLLSNALQAAVNVVANLSDLATLTTTQVAQELNNQLTPYLNNLNNTQFFNGTVVATVDSGGNVVLTVDAGRTINLPFTLGDLGMSGLGLDLAGQANAQLSYNLDFRIGADGSGFWIDPAQSAVSLGAKVDLNGLSVGGNLGLLHFAVSNIQDNDPSADADTLSFNIGSTFNGSGLMRSFGGDIIDFKASGAVDLDLHLAGDLSSAALPSLSADFHVDWDFNQALLNGTDANSWGSAAVGFTNVQYNFGSYVETTIRPIVDALVPVLKPINDALAIFRTDIQGALPGDWRVPLDFNHDGKVTLLDFLQKAGDFTGHPIDTAAISSLIDTIDQIVDFAEFLAGKDFSDAGYNIGDYSVQFAQIQGAANALASLNVGTSGFTNAAPASLGSFLAGLASGNSTGFGAMSGGQSGATLITELVGNPVLSFPLIENPLQAIKLLIGQDVDLFKFDMPAINIGTGLNAQGNLTNPLTVFTFPIWPFPLVQVQVNVAAQLVTDLAFGYDTAGIRYWLAQGSNLSNIADIFTHGFYLDDQRSGGTDIAEFVVRAAIELAVTAGFGITLGGGGNLMGSVELNLADALTTPDGKLHLSDLPAQFGIANPFAIFDVDGQISAGARFWVDGPFGNIFNYNTPRITLLNLSNKQDATVLGVSAAGNVPAVQPPPPGLADIITSGGVTGLWIAVGPLAGNRDIANKTDGGEIIDISPGGTGKLLVAGFDQTQLFNLSDFTTIQADAGNGNDEIVIAAGVTVSARLTGGQGNDFLQGGDAGDFLYGGTEDDYLAGGGGNDRLDGEDGNDRLEGGTGADALYGGNGPNDAVTYDTATYANAASGITLNLTNPLLNTGDALGDTFFGIEIYEGSRLNDTMVGSAGTDIFTALDGDDTLQGLGGDDTLAGGLGTNTIDGGDGFDIVNYYNITSPVTVVGFGSGYLTTAGPINTPIVADTIVNVEQINGTPYGDTMLGDTLNDIFVGADGDDTLDGGAGDDTLIGGNGADTLRGGAGTNDRASYIFSGIGVTASLLNPAVNTGEATGDTYDGIEGLRGSQFNDTLSGDDSANLLQGAEGNDTLNGNGGDDVLQGGVGADALNGGGGQDTASYINSTTWVVLNLQPGGADENDAVGDTFTSIEIYQGTRFSDDLTGSDSGEQLWGEDGNDKLHGMGGDDTLLGAAGADQIWGEAGNDTIDGGADSDLIYGGSGIDTIRGGTEADTIYGEGDGDVLYGEDGNDIVDGGTGDDTIRGGIGSDTVKGGDDNDSVFGDDGDDFVYGDGGIDTLNGGQGNDLIDGGTGRDRVIYSGGTTGVKLNLGGATRVLDGVNVAGFTGLDNFATTDSFVSVGVLATVEDVTGSQFSDFIVTNQGGSDVDAMDGNDTVFGLAGSDVLKGGAGADTLDGGDGNDTVNGGAGADDLQGGTGTDWVSYEYDTAGVTASLATNTATDGSGAADTLGGFENLRGSNSGDTLTGDDANNVIEGLNGNDIINGGLGGDTMRGGFGDDIYYVDAIGTGGDTVQDDGGYDLVRISVDMRVGGVPYFFDIEDIQLIGTAKIGFGNSGNNLIMGNAENNVFDGLGGSDTFWGYGGDDTYYFDSLGDSIGTVTAFRALTAGAGEVAGGGSDTILLSTANIYGGTLQSPTVYTYDLNRSDLQFVENVVLTDNARQVNLTGNAQGNRLVGNDFSQVIRGEGGDDVMVVGIGDDDTFGGDGNDTLVVDWSRSPYGVDMFAVTAANAALGGYDGDFRNSSQGWYASFVSTERFEITTGNGGDSFKLGNGADIVVLNGGDDFVDIGSGYDRGDGGAGIDGITADYSAETLGINWNLAANTYSEGTDGTANDHRAFTNFEFFGTLITGSGNDVIVTTTESRNDVVRTGDGDDRVTFRVGDDDLYAGLGLDTLVVDWSQSAYGADMRVATTVNTTLGGFDGDFRNSSQGWYASFESVERFEITTGSGGDTIVTMTGDDIVKLGAGNDFVDIGSGRDEADGGTGNDGISADYRTDTTAVLWDLQANTYSGAGRVFTNFEYFGTLRTGSGNDVIVTDTLNVGETIDTGAGNDRVTFFSGADTYVAGSGLDTLVIDWSASPYGADTPGSPSGTLAAGYDGLFRNSSQGWTVSYAGVERFEISTGSGGDSIVTGAGDDIVKLGAGGDFVNIGSGRDEADGGTGNDGISADYSTDTTAILWDLQANTYSGAGRVFTGFEYFGTLKTGSGNDVIVTDKLDVGETIDTGAGDDRVTFFSGADTYVAGAGLDTLVIDWSASPYGVDTPGLPNGSLAAGYGGLFRNSSQGWTVSYAGVERFEITTGSGGDSVFTGAGDDIVKLGAGNDFVNIGSGHDRGDGGDGIDRISADYSTDTLAINWNLAANAYSEGTDGTANDRRAFTNFELFGTLRTGSGNDVIVTTTENSADLIYTGDGDDRVTFRAGDDDLLAGLGNDTLVVDWSAAVYGVDMAQVTTANTILGGYNGDFRASSHGWYASFESVERFEITTGSGGDNFQLGNGDDIARLNDGNDFVNVGSGRDEADGGAGNDGISADYSTDTTAILWDLQANTYSGGGRVFTNFEYFGGLKTGDGNDVIVTDTLNLGETINTGAGNDRVTFFSGNDVYTAGSGLDTLVIDWSASAYGVDTPAQPTNPQGLGYAGYFRNSSQGWSVDYTGVERFEISTGNSGDSIYTGVGDDIVRLNGGSDFVNIGSGRDEADGGAGDDGISADYSTDTTAILWNLQANTYSGGGRIFANFEFFGTLRTGSGNDVIVTDKLGANETIDTGGGNDRVTVFSGNDTINAGSGTDTLVIDWSASPYGVDTPGRPGGSQAAGYSGYFRNSSQGWSASYSGIERFEITTGGSGDGLYTGDGDDVIHAGGGNDYIEAAGGNDLIDGGIGDDTMIGGAGDDSYTVDSLGDVVTENAGEGIDAVETTLAAYTLAANVETLSGVSSVRGQALTGNALDNVISGTTFGDTLTGGAGDDTLYGGGGNDFFVAGKGTNDQIFGDGGTDTVIIDGTLANWEFTQLGDGRIQLKDLRDPTHAVAFLTSVERVEITGVGSITMVQALAGNAANPAPGTTGNDVVVITVPGGLLDLSQGGSDQATGSSGADAVLFGEQFDPTDQFDGADGDDQIGLQGNYTLTFGANVINTEQLTLLSGADTRFGASGSALFSYNLTTNNATVATGVNYTVQANQLLAGENLQFDGRAETDGSFILYAGRGDDKVTGGRNSDGFYFGDGRFTALDSVDGFDGPDDQIGLRGDYSTLVVLGPDSIRNIDTFVLISSTVARFGAPLVPSSFNIKSHDANVAAGATMTVQAQSLQANEVAIFDGSAETNGQFFFIGGAAGDRFIGGAGADRFFGAGGADTLTGGAGNDTFLYNREANSTPTAFDTITDFAVGDIIDLALVDAIAGGANDAFTFATDGLFTGVAGQLRVRADSGYWFVEGDTNGDGVADLTIRLTSDHALTATDFIL